MNYIFSDGNSQIQIYDEESFFVISVGSYYTPLSLSHFKHLLSLCPDYKIVFHDFDYLKKIPLYFEFDDIKYNCVEFVYVYDKGFVLRLWKHYSIDIVFSGLFYALYDKSKSYFQNIQIDNLPGRASRDFLSLNIGKFIRGGALSDHGYFIGGVYDNLTDSIVASIDYVGSDVNLYDQVRRYFTISQIISFDNTGLFTFLIYPYDSSIFLSLNKPKIIDSCCENLDYSPIVRLLGGQ